MEQSEYLEEVNSEICSIVEFRQYTLYPGQRDVLIELFDREFIESQEALGIEIIGQFRDHDDPNLFVWLRGFRDMQLRLQALSAFYGGPVWKAHRELANSTMLDSSNVLLLRPARSTSGFSIENNNRPPQYASEALKGLVVATIYYFDSAVDDDFVDFFERLLKPELINTGATVLAYYVTESRENNFPALPVREDENIFIWYSIFSDQEAYEHHITALAQSKQWSDDISKALASRLKELPEVRKLMPTSRSRIHLD